MTKSTFRWIAVFAWIFTAAISTNRAEASVAVAQQIQGEVQILKAGAPDNSWQSVSAETALESGDSIRTSKGTFKLVYSDEASFGVDENTSLTVNQQTDRNDIQLVLGKIKGKIDKQKASRPFQISTPAAVATVRGTEVDFGYNDQNELVIDLHNGKIEVVNTSAEMKFDLEGKKTVWVKYSKDLNLIRIKNDCSSDGPIKLNILGAEYSEGPCGEKEISLATGQDGSVPPVTNLFPGTDENPNEGREAISPTNNES